MDSQRASGIWVGGHNALAVLVLADQLAVFGAIECQRAVQQAQQDEVLSQGGTAGRKRLASLAAAGG